MQETSPSVVAAALAVARSQGLRCDEPIVLRDAWHVLLHLQPLPVVARVSAGRPFPEGPKPDDVVRELAVAAHAARAGAPVVPPADEVEAVPYEHGGHIVTFWRYVDPHGAADACQAGRGLRTIHEALADLDGPLPEAGHPHETGEMLDFLSPDPGTELLREIVSRRPELDGQPLHGDAHLGNCLGSSGGPLWHDFETACRGPREYDLAALVMGDRIQVTLIAPSATNMSMRPVAATAEAPATPSVATKDAVLVFVMAAEREVGATTVRNLVEQLVVEGREQEAVGSGAGVRVVDNVVL